MKKKKRCAQCGAEIDVYINPIPTVDVIIETEEGGIVLIKRKSYPFQWALPGGFVDYGESLEEAAIREAKEETNLDIVLTKQFHTYSKPDRDPRHHTITTVYLARAKGTPKAKDDASEVGVFTRDTLPSPLAFDHANILSDFFASKDKKE